MFPLHFCVQQGFSSFWDLRFTGLLLLDRVVSECKNFLKHFVGWFLSSKSSKWFDDVLDDLVESPKPLAENHAHVDVLEVEHGDGHVGTEDAHEEDAVSVDVLEHEGDTDHLYEKEYDLHYNPVKGFPLYLRKKSHFYS